MRQWLKQLAGEDVTERPEEVSADLPYELQSRMFDQLATISIAGAGLSVTLIGTLLRDPPPLVWACVPLFGLAALSALSGNERLITGLFKRTPTLKRSRLHIQIALGLIGMASGFLTMGIYSAVTRPAEVAAPSAAAAPAPPAPAATQR